MKKSDAAAAVMCEFTTGSGSQPGSFGLIGPSAAATPSYFARSRGATLNSDLTTPSSYAAPHSAVLLMEAKISTDFLALAVNANQHGPVSGDQSTGNYANDTLYIQARAGTSLRSSCGWTALTIFGGSCTASQKSAITRRHARLAKVKL
jgi:hypothetical protein